MKIQSSSVALLVASAVTLAVANPTGCYNGTVDSTTDLFPNKVKPVVSEAWDIEYHNTYKILYNKALNTSYLLYQCGTSALATQAYNATPIEIPVRKVAVSETNTISFLEQLNQLASIVAYTSDPTYIGSPCLLESITAGNVFVVPNRSVYENYVATNTEAATKLQGKGIVAFGGPYDMDFPFDSATVLTSTENENTNGAIFEWIKFYAAFFNLEEMANTAFNAAQDRTACISTGATLAVTDRTPPTLLWGYYSTYCNGWDIGKCPNYYCEFATACSANILSTEYGTGSIEACDTTFMNITEVMALGKDADYWIFPSQDWDVTYAQFKTELDQFKSVQNKQVYDVQGSGINAWFEQRYAEYYNVQQDFCRVVGTTTGLSTEHWFRNVLQNETINDESDSSCANLNRTALLPYDFNSCEFRPSTTTDNTTTTNTGTTGGTDTNTTTNTTNTEGQSGAATVTASVVLAFSMILSSFLL